MPDEAYRFERSTDLQPTNWVPVFETSGEESTNVEFSDYNPAGIGFYRAVYLSPGLKARPVAPMRASGDMLDRL